MSGQIFLPSIIRSLGTSAPVRCARVGRMSIVAATSEQTRPAGMRPGQRIMHGTRIPPS